MIAKMDVYIARRGMNRALSCIYTLRWSKVGNIRDRILGEMGNYHAICRKYEETSAKLQHV